MSALQVAIDGVHGRANGGYNEPRVGDGLAGDGFLDDGLVDALCRAVAEVPGDVTDVVRSHVGSVAPLVHGAHRERLVHAAIARLAGLDRLEALMSDPAVDEILVNRGGEVWVDRGGRLERAERLPEHAVAVILERVLAPLGRRLDRSSPIVDARLTDGSRVCAVVPPVAVDGAVLAIRRFRRRTLPVRRFCGPEVADLLRELVHGRCNVVIAGATSSGKTSLLGALLAEIAPDDRVVVLEDTAELSVEHGHVVRLETRPAGPDGPRGIDLDELVRTALRLRPDRLVVGEIRGPEVLALIQAMNTGHDGSLSTCHANGPDDALSRLETLVLQAAPSWPLAAIRAQLTRSIDVVVHVDRATGGSRAIQRVTEVVAGDGPPTVRDLARDGRVVGRPTRERRRGGEP